MTEAEQPRSVAMLSGIEDAMRVNSFAIALVACDSIRPQDIPNLLLAYVETMPKATPWRIGIAGGDHDAGDDIEAMWVDSESDARAMAMEKAG